MKCIGGILLAAVLCVTLLPMQTTEAASEGSITLKFALSDCAFQLYRVADYTGKGGFELTADFDDTSVNWSELDEDEEWYTLASTLRTVVVDESIDAAVEAKTDTDGSVTFSNLAAGLYLVTAEQATAADGTVYTVTPTLVAVPGANTAGAVEYDRTLEIKYATAAPTVVTETVDVTVQKIWDDGDGTDRPESISVTLYHVTSAGGTVTEEYATVTLRASDNWSYTWTGLDDDGEWVAAETVPDGYQVTYETADDGTLVITNTKKEEQNTEGTETDATESELSEASEVSESSENSEASESSESTPDSEDTGDKLPQTGMDWGPAAILVLLGLICLMIGFIKNRMGKRSE